MVVFRIIVLILFLAQNTLANEGKSVEAYIGEAQVLFAQGKVLDGRAKLLKALDVDKKDYRPHLFLGAYYLFDVGHFRLARRYVQNAKKNFEERYGGVGRVSDSLRPEYTRILLLEIECQKSLDDYEGSLRLIDKFLINYDDQSIYSSKAWVLFKLGRVKEAYRVANESLMNSGDYISTANVLAILQSVMGEREKAIESFKRIINYQLSSGNFSQLSTPLNNMGEVYRETFQEKKAENSWLRALSLPDGCQHILPSLNLVHLYIDELRLFQAKRVLKDFESCHEQNGASSDAEHRSLLTFLRAKIALRMGDIEEGVRLLQVAANKEQWFGNIGTTAEDLKFAISSTLSLAYSSKLSWLENRRSEGVIDWAMKFYEKRSLQLLQWWYRSRGLSIALEELADFEDLYIRNTDAMVEYPTLGRVVGNISGASLESRLELLKKEDDRVKAGYYYDMYYATNRVLGGDYDEAISILEKLWKQWPESDKLARAEILALLIYSKKENFWFWQDLTGEEASKLDAMSNLLFGLSPAVAKEYGILLSVELLDKGDGVARKWSGEFDGTLIEPGDASSHYMLVMSQLGDKLKFTFIRRADSRVLMEYEVDVEEDEALIVNAVVDRVFRHHEDI